MTCEHKNIKSYQPFQGQPEMICWDCGAPAPPSSSQHRAAPYTTKFKVGDAICYGNNVYWVRRVDFQAMVYSLSNEPSSPTWVETISVVDATCTLYSSALCTGAQIKNIIETEAVYRTSQNLTVDKAHLSPYEYDLLHDEFWPPSPLRRTFILFPLLPTQCIITIYSNPNVSNGAIKWI